MPYFDIKAREKMRWCGKRVREKPRGAAEREEIRKKKKEVKPGKRILKNKEPSFQYCKLGLKTILN